MPVVASLYKYWDQWPPTHETTRLAWLDGAPKTKADKATQKEGGDVLTFTSMPQVTSSWVGPPPMRPQDVIDLAERMKKRG